jgi:hypothetical protein
MAETLNTHKNGNCANCALAAGTFQVTVRISDFRGDHATDVEVALNVSSEMAIGELISKVFHSTEIRNFDKLHDAILLRACS